MDSSSHNLPKEPTAKPIAPEFGTWPMNETQVTLATAIRTKFDDLLSDVVACTPAGNERYLAIVKTKLEEACMFAVKAIAKPASKNQQGGANGN